VARGLGGGSGSQIVAGMVLNVNARQLVRMYLDG
jgi:hypothetical protein